MNSSDYYKIFKIFLEDSDGFGCCSYLLIFFSYILVALTFPFSLYCCIKVIISELFKKHNFKHLVLVQTEECDKEETMMKKHAEYVAQGYEGIMLRNKDGLYKGTRTNDLQKYKQFMDDEYKVVGFEEGSGLEKGAVIWVCVTPNKTEFRVRPRGTRESRQELFANGADYIGKMLTVRFQELTDDGIPRFPVGIAFREEYE